MAKHTPGPWRYVKANPSPTTGEHLISGAQPGYLAEVRDCGSGDVMANARLIAAAPDLLRAATRALNVFKGQGESIQRGNVLEALDSAIRAASPSTPE